MCVCVCVCVYESKKETCIDPEVTEYMYSYIKDCHSPCFCGIPENLNLSGLGPGSPHNAGPTPWRAAWSLSSVDGESTHTRPERGQTQCGRNTGSAPHTRQWHLPAAPLPPHSRTEQANLNKRPPLPTCVRVKIRHWRDLQTEAKETKGTTSEVTGATD